MDLALNNALSQPDVKRVMLLAVGHADATMRRYIWRGFRPKASGESQLMVGDQTADDFVNEALKRLLDGTRAYNPARSLLENLNSVTDSLISSAKKSSDRTGVVDFVEETKEDGLSSDPVSTAVGSELATDTKMLEDEIIADQRKCFQMLRASFDGDKEMQDYLDALSERFFDLAEISDLTGIPVSKIYELRRKLKQFAPKFFGVKNAKELVQKIMEGK
jgi:DNA-directed RNA polymerase specialized sigma24 family protein